MGLDISLVAWSGLLILEFASMMRQKPNEINTLEEIKILKAASTKYLINDVIAGQTDPMYELLPSSVISTPRSTT